MKKLLTIAASIAVASAVSAAGLNWNITAVTDATTGQKVSGYSAYLFISEQSGDFGAKTASADEISTLITSGGDFAEYIAAGPTLTSAAGGVSGATGYNGNNFGAGDSLTAFAVIFDAADYASAKNFIVTAAKSASWTSPTGSKSLGFGSQANATWTAVPEPATAALALLGLGLMIKRRKA
ncbi:MAG: PEP-CTERM sorting domain-containing protein [Kiritimatiellae bacterium]|nr:PEP-CTERM sorting domain-containing protein [Kiritimatiellia bacterium]